VAGYLLVKSKQMSTCILALHSYNTFLYQELFSILKEGAELYHKNDSGLFRGGQTRLQTLLHCRTMFSKIMFVTTSPCLNFIRVYLLC
jgi:hypothetical protein